MLNLLYYSVYLRTFNTMLASTYCYHTFYTYCTEQVLILTTYYLLLTTDYLPLTTYHLLLTTCCTVQVLMELMSPALLGEFVVQRAHLLCALCLLKLLGPVLSPMLTMLIKATGFCTKSVLRLLLAHSCTPTTGHYLASRWLLIRRWKALLQLFPTPCR